MLPPTAYHLLACRPLTSRGCTHVTLQVHMKAPASAATANMLLSPMPGTLLSLAVAVGAKVSVLGRECVSM